jgi:hypothetical protein
MPGMDLHPDVNRMAHPIREREMERLDVVETAGNRHHSSDAAERNDATARVRVK